MTILRSAVILFFFLLLFPATNGQTAEDDEGTICPGVSVQMKDKCYYYYSSSLTWEEAEAACEEQAGLLAIFESLLDAKRVLDSIMPLQTRESTALTWIGISRDGDDKYRWADGEIIDDSWTKSLVEDDQQIQGRGCLGVNLTSVKNFDGNYLYLRECTTTLLSYLCVVDEENSIWSQWSWWTACSASCGPGRRTRQRKCIQATNDQTSCSGEDSEQGDCSLGICITQGASWEDWGEWSSCNQTCGIGVRSRVRSCSKNGVTSDQCLGSSSGSTYCVSHCKGISKSDLVQQLKPKLNPETLSKLETWAKSTSRVRENFFDARNLRNFAISGHVIATHIVSSPTVCVVRCLSMDGCGSFNFQHQTDKPGQHVCEVNSVGRAQAVTDLRIRNGFTLYDFSVFIPYIVD